MKNQGSHAYIFFTYLTSYFKVSYFSMAAGNDPCFTIARAWLQVTPSVRPYSFKAMHIHKGGVLKIKFFTSN